MTFETIEEAGAVQQALQPLVEKTIDGDSDETANKSRIQALNDSGLNENERMLQQMILMNFMGRQKVKRVSELRQSRRLLNSLSEPIPEDDSLASKSFGIVTSENSGSNPSSGFLPNANRKRQLSNIFISQNTMKDGVRTRQ